MRKRLLRRTVLVPALAGITSCGFSHPSSDVKLQLTVRLPLPTAVDEQAKMKCTALMDMDMTGSYDTARAQGLEGTVSPGHNDASVLMEGARMLRFLSGPGSNAGAAPGSPFNIVVNTREELVATFLTAVR